MSGSRKKPSSAAIVAAQVQAKNEQNSTIKSIVKARADHWVDQNTGELTFGAIFPQPEGGEPHKIDLGFLLEFPKLQPIFTEAILAWGVHCKKNTRSGVVGVLRRGFFKYLRECWHVMLTPEDVDDEILVGFKEHLLRRVSAKGKPLHPATVSSLLDALRSVLGALDSGAWVINARHIVERIPAGPTGAGAKSQPTEVLDLEAIVSILQAAEKEILEIEARRALGEQLLIEGRAKLLDPTRVKSGNRNDYSDLSVCLAALDSAYSDLIPDLEDIMADNSPLGYAVKHIHGQREVCSYFSPTGRDLAPFVLLLTIATVFNPETVLKLSWNDVDIDKDRAGTPVIEIWGTKARAKRDPVCRIDPGSSVSSNLSLHRLLTCLKKITERIRAAADPSNIGYLFLCVQQVGKKRPKCLGEEVGRGGSSVWKWALKGFISDNKLSSFTLRQLRPTILSLVQFIDGSLEAAQRVGNHKNPVTTWTHYTSSAVKKRYREKIGQIILLRERWIETQGTIDPRRLQPRQEKGAATPGFLCLDPFDSPRPNQQPGKLCKDYGGCPACPMAAAFPNEVVSVGYYFALEVAIYKSQSVMSTKTWFERWVPVLTDLRALLALVPPDVLAESRKFSIKLPNVG
nr:hypothetical protein [Massilia aurea]